MATHVPPNAYAAVADVLSRLKAQQLIALAGSNGAGKSTFHRTVLSCITDLPFVNADEIAKTLPGEAGPTRDYEAARMAEALRKKFIAEKWPFCMETVFSDPDGQKIGLLLDAQEAGYSVLLIFVGIPDASLSQARVTNRVANGGHDVPDDKLVERFPRTLQNLERAVQTVQHVLLLDNSRRDTPYAPVALVEHGKIVWRLDSLPDWAMTALKGVL